MQKSCRSRYPRPPGVDGPFRISSMGTTIFFRSASPLSGIRKTWFEIVEGAKNVVGIREARVTERALSKGCKIRLGDVSKRQIALHISNVWEDFFALSSLYSNT